MHGSVNSLKQKDHKMHLQKQLLNRQVAKRRACNAVLSKRYEKQRENQCQRDLAFQSVFQALSPSLSHAC